MASSDADVCNMALLYAGVNQKIGSLNDASPNAQACNTVYAEYRRQLLQEFRWPFSIKRAQVFPITGAAYDPTVNYGKGVYAQYGAAVYRSLQANNLNQQPNLDASAAWWAQVTRDGWAYVAPLPGDYLDFIKVWEKPTIASSQASSPQPYSFPRAGDPNIRTPRSSERVPAAIENANDGTDAMVLLTDVDEPILEYVADVLNPAQFPPSFVEALAWRISVPLAMGLRGDEKKAAECARMAVLRVAQAFVVQRRDEQPDEEPVSEFESARQGGD